ncbi:membrane protein [Pandoraea apista]|uniref:Membrane protein n=1 Tax=Pandoraea apista TaxID=93218 RepID=A0A5E5P1H8_9BURK|nr:membrane protein [Pandoraea apista]
MRVEGAQAPSVPAPSGLSEIDWRAPWFDAVSARGQAALASGDWREALSAQAAAAGLVSGQGRALRFVAQEALPAATAYEAFIAATGGVPTRRNLHDFFNALIWLTYPLGKAALNARQAVAIATEGVRATRGAARDAATVFDENAVLFACSDAALGEALRAFDWHTLFVARRADWGLACEVQPFGHALLEKLVAPYPSVTAHAWIVDVPPAYFRWASPERRAWLDARIAPTLAGAAWTTRDFAPLPVLGVPGWWPANDNPSYYLDRSVFRPGRRQKG